MPNIHSRNNFSFNNALYLERNYNKMSSQQQDLSLPLLRQS